MQGEFLMANVDDINIGELESSLDRARQQTALLKAIRGDNPTAAPVVQAFDSIARDLEALAKQLRAQSDHAAMAAAGVKLG